jgi:hypothetical protein
MSLHSRIEVTGKHLNSNLVMEAHIFPASSASAQASLSQFLCVFCMYRWHCVFVCKLCICKLCILNVIAVEKLRVVNIECFASKQSLLLSNTR